MKKTFTEHINDVHIRYSIPTFVTEEVVKAVSRHILEEKLGVAKDIYAAVSGKPWDGGQGVGPQSAASVLPRFITDLEKQLEDL